MAVVVLHPPYPSPRFLVSRERSFPSLTCRVAGGGFEVYRSLCAERGGVQSACVVMAQAGGVGKRKVPHVLTVAGSDSGAGAGIQADLKACGALGVYCSSVITAVTAQNTLGVQGIHPVPADFVEDQLRSVLSDMEVDVVKTGMLPSVDIIKTLCGKLREFRIKALVVDPVMVSTSGDILAAPATLNAIREELLPMADIVTPNLKEASVLLDGLSLETVADMFMAARSIHELGARNVIIKGGHLPDSSDAIDVFFDGEQFLELRGQRVKTQNTHGTGCTLASSIAAELAKGSSMHQAVKAAKIYVESALNYSKDINIGGGPQGPFDHFLKINGHVRRFNPDDLLLYAVTDSRMNKKWGRSIAEAVEAAIEGGATMVQLREKEADTRDFIDAAAECIKICRHRNVPLLINDRVDVALACGADGVHVGQSDMPASTVRALLGPTKIIGVSCKTPSQAASALAGGADYIGSGGVFFTTTKAGNLTIGLDGLKTVCMASKLPVVAIGGIGLNNAGSVMELSLPNLKGVAVVSALFDQESIVDQTQKLKSSLMTVNAA